MDKLIAKARTANDATLILSGLAVDTAASEEARMVQAACVEVLVERHPELEAALDAWEMDLESELTMIEVIADTLKGWEE